MSTYKVKLGEKIVPVEGLAGLVKLAQSGELKPDDPVFIPSSNKWHYARSVRQLREFFPGLEPPPPQPPEPEPEPQPGADVVPLRRGRWTADGKGVQVPVFSYDVDLQPPKWAYALRLLLIVAVGGLVASLYGLYSLGYASYANRRFGNSGVEPGKLQVFASPTPFPAGTRGSAPRTPATPARTAVVVATPVPLGYDAADAVAKVAGLPLTAVSRPDLLGAAMRADLLKLAVPVRSVTVLPGKGARNAAVPFTIRAEYAAPEGMGAAVVGRQRLMVVAMAGRRINELHLSVDAIHVSTRRGTKKGKITITQVTVPVALATRIASGGGGADELELLFRGK